MMHTYIIKFKEVGREWLSTTYTSPESITEEFLIKFFGLNEDDVEDYTIEQKNDGKED